ncbi:DUF262 domain-containing protein [Shewanella violacea]|uniref:GmrSD restriction endonucleases N-terminal domain-containing protein n=1 Tax=Shewanella violacea (strain JCM 10179 / CIP 106290 / LMG 19151 / DSS12) TaxID=637905 RepID=D4ZK74_SHEVD|nr:DUF262 domain-containing protein [Shewanella violacea]BAJ02073.1 hypothetical protein SVI_2102 [Shewanella violacea DSS12]
MKIKILDSDLHSIHTRISQGIIDLQPDFQRGSVWSPPKQKKLVDSILRGWQVPPVHVIRTEEYSLEVLDGQQRLRAVYDFMNNEFKIKGDFEPIDSSIEELNGLYYKQLPEPIKRKLDFYSIRMLEVYDYEPGETGELFNRLNQSLNLTAAEKRNAQIGVTRTQIKSLSVLMHNVGLDTAFIGFSNTRMAYDDLFAKLSTYLEKRNIRAKVTDSELYEQYRNAIPYDDKIIESIEYTLRLLSEVKQELIERDLSIHITKATLFSWLFFISSIYINDKEKIDKNRIKESFITFESMRYRFKNNIDDSVRWSGIPFPKEKIHAIFSLFNERASSRVMSTGSLLIRDWAISLYYYLQNMDYAGLTYQLNELGKIIISLNSDELDIKATVERLAESGDQNA